MTVTTAEVPTAQAPPAKVPAASRGDRPASFDVADFGSPTGREEEWRFTPLRRVGALLAGAPSTAHLHWNGDLPEPVTSVVIKAGDPVLRDVPAPADRIAALAMANSDGAVAVDVPAGAVPDRPVRIELRGDPADGRPVWGHVLLRVGAGAEVTMVIEHTGSTTYGAAVSVLIGDGARLTLVQVQDWQADSVHSAHVGIRLGRDASINSTQVSIGGDLVRVVETVEFTAQGGEAELAGLYFASAGQHLEHRLFVDHAVPDCRSDVNYRGALQGRDAHTVWIGDVLIRAKATGTDTYEINRNLVLSDGARADSVPNLEIETGEVAGAGHASTTGRFDDEQLFYLQSRGIPEEEARRLVVRGFFAELLGRIPVPELGDRLLSTVENRLGEVNT